MLYMFHANVKMYVLNECVMLNWCKVACVKYIFKDACVKYIFKDVCVKYIFKDVFIKRICKDVRVKCTCKYSKITAPKFADVEELHLLSNLQINLVTFVFEQSIQVQSANRYCADVRLCQLIHAPVVHKRRKKDKKMPGMVKLRKRSSLRQYFLVMASNLAVLNVIPFLLQIMIHKKQILFCIHQMAKGYYGG